MAAALRRVDIYSALTSRLSSQCRVASCSNSHHCKLLVVGGGTGGCNVAWRFSRKLEKNDIIVLDPSQFHYYQPLFSLIGAGLKPYEDCKKPLESVLPPNVTLFRDYADTFDPCNNLVHTRCGDKIYYEFMVVAVGLGNDYDKVTGLKAALDAPCSCVSTIYSPDYCCKTWADIRRLQGGHVVFTFPGKGSKCSGAAQKIMYLADDYFRQKNTRHLMNITYNTGGEAIFGVPKYAEALTKVAEARDVAVNCCMELVEVTPTNAVFSDACGVLIVVPYNLLHVTPPMSPPSALRVCTELASNGYLDVDKGSLQHTQYPNVYGIGDCTSTPNSKTAAAITSQSLVLEKNLSASMAGRAPAHSYDGYGACAMLTSRRTGMLAEFLYDKRPQETFPFDQSKERRFFSVLQTHYFPHLYWNKIIKGKWNGPSSLRKFINPLAKK